MSATWPRVSTILKVLDPDTYNGVPSGVLATAAERGERLHRLCLTYLAGRKVWFEHERPVVDEVDRPAYEAFVRWCDHHDVEDIAIEQDDVCTKHQYRGTPDALVMFGPKQIPTLIDLKFTASILRINRIQVQAYHKLDLYTDAKQMMIVHITPKDGHLKQETIKHDPRDWAAFLNALSVWKWRQS